MWDHPSRFLPDYTAAWDPLRKLTRPLDAFFGMYRERRRGMGMLSLNMKCVRVRASALAPRRFRARPARPRLLPMATPPSLPPSHRRAHRRSPRRRCVAPELLSDFPFPAALAELSQQMLSLGNWPSLYIYSAPASLRVHVDTTSKWNYWTTLHRGAKRVRIIPFSEWVRRLSRYFGVGQGSRRAAQDPSRTLAGRTLAQAPSRTPAQAPSTPLAGP